MRATHPNKQPNSNQCFICGRDNPSGLYMTFYDNGVDEVISEYTVGQNFQGYPGIVHGGISAAMIDEAVGRIAFIGDHHRFMLSVTMDVKYRHPVPIDTPLLILGRIVRLRTWLGKAVGQVVLPNGDVAVEAELTLANMPDHLLENVNWEALGWHIDP